MFMAVCWGISIKRTVLLVDPTLGDKGLDFSPPMLTPSFVEIFFLA